MFGIPVLRIKAYLSQLLFSIVYLLPVCIFALLVMGPFEMRMQAKNIRALIFICTVIFGMLILKVRKSNIGWIESFAFSLLAYGVVYKAFTFIPDVTSYPWSLGWSEASRYYYASLFFSQKVYGQAVSPSVLHPTRYLMQSLPFLLPDPSLWLHRFWQVSLWLGMSLLTARIIAKRFGAGWGLAFFAILFLFEGPVYYHLLVIVAIVVGCVDLRNFKSTMGIVLLASIWAGMSRVNWFPMPGLLASLLYFIFIPLGKKNWVRYNLPPLVWTLAGTGLAFLTQLVYIRLSGNPPEQFSSSFTSDLLWYRLWPNATYGPGIIRSLWRISFPMLLIVLARWIPNWRRFHGLRLLGILAILIVLLAGGIVVSVKIGGGSNLHNLDAYLVVLLLIAVAFYKQKVIPEPDQNQMISLRAQGMLWPLVFFAILFPIRDVTQLGGAIPDWGLADAWEEVATLEKNVIKEVESGREVLFIDQRHLLTTHMIENTPLVSDYEVVFLMEMVMGNNRAYLDKFTRDLKNHRFGYIISGTPKIIFQDLTFAFAEENNVWVERVTVPLLCYYEISVELPKSGISLLSPREVPCQ